VLESRTILIVDDNAYNALDLSSAIEANGGRVAGPVDTFAEAVAILESEDIAGAIIDGELAQFDASELVTDLARRDVPFVLQLCAALPPAVDGLDGRAVVLTKPVDPGLVVASLSIVMNDDTGGQNPIKLGSQPKQV
jgi:DNA-binding response OmpR family regulator